MKPSYVLRTVVVGMTILIAAAVPYFAQVMQLVGSLCITMIVYILPVMFSFRLWGDRMSTWQKIYGVAIVLCGTAAGAYASVSTIISIIAKLRAGDKQ